MATGDATAANTPPSANLVTVRSWHELIRELHAAEIIPTSDMAGGHHRSPFLFRGMSSVAWPLLTSLERLRSPPEKIEEAALRAFAKYSPMSTFQRHSEWERMAVAQHNGLPTRVLDWTASPLVAAHFATAESEHWDEDGVVWCVNVSYLRDTVLPDPLRQQLAEAHAWVYDVRLLETHYPTLRHFDDTHGLAGDILIFIEPPSIDARIQNQFGLLSMMNGPALSHDQYLRRIAAKHPEVVRKVVIDKGAKPEIRDMLDQNNITERMLFPGLPGLCSWLKRYYGPAR